MYIVLYNLGMSGTDALAIGPINFVHTHRCGAFRCQAGANGEFYVLNRNEKTDDFEVGDETFADAAFVADVEPKDYSDFRLVTFDPRGLELDPSHKDYT